MLSVSSFSQLLVVFLFAYIIYGTLFDAGRGTRIFPGVALKSNQDYGKPIRQQYAEQIVLVKDSWRLENAAKEWKTLSELNETGVEHTPTLICG